MNIVVFEDRFFRNLLPLVYFRPVWDLRCGPTTLLEKIQKQFSGQKLFFSARSYLQDYYLDHQLVFQPDEPENYLFINGRLLLNEENLNQLSQIPENKYLKLDDQLLAFRIDKKNLTSYFENGIILEDRIFNDFDGSNVELNILKYPWDFIDFDGTEITREVCEHQFAGQLNGAIESGVHIMQKDNVYVAPDARIMPGVVLNAEDGPIWIDSQAKIMPNATLEGPLYIGTGSQVKIGAKIYENTSIGPVCKVGGEVEETIFQGYSNKQHDGFLGHAYLGEWVNLGADTNNSDLKNNYGEIEVYLNGSPVKSGKRFVGLIMGDHSKTAINTMFNTGTVVGVNCNIYGEGFPPKFIPSFAWGGSSGLREYRFDKAVEVARVVMNRRNIKFTENHLKQFEAIQKMSNEIENRTRMR